MLTFSKISVCQSCDNDKWGLLIPNQTMLVCKLSSEAFIHVHMFIHIEKGGIFDEIWVAIWGFCFYRISGLAFRTLREGHVRSRALHTDIITLGLIGRERKSNRRNAVIPHQSTYAILPHYPHCISRLSANQKLSAVSALHFKQMKNLLRFPFWPSATQNN